MKQRDGFSQGFSTAAGAAAFGALLLLALRFAARWTDARGPVLNAMRQGDSFAFLVDATEASSGSAEGGATCSAVY